jgi:hypothetical protein
MLHLSSTERAYLVPASAKHATSILAAWKSEHDELVQRNAALAVDSTVMGPWDFWRQHAWFEHLLTQHPCHAILLTTRGFVWSSRACIGFVCVSRSKATQTAEMELFWVHQAYRERGWGRRLVLKLVEPLLIGPDVRCVSLEAVDNNRMFWEQACGYRPDPTQNEEDAFFSIHLVKREKSSTVPVLT